jgi:hypothetical protein
MAKIKYSQADITALVSEIIKRARKQKSDAAKEFRAINKEGAGLVLKYLMQLPTWFLKDQGFSTYTVEDILDLMERCLFEYPEIKTNYAVENEVRLFLLKGGDISKVEETIKGLEETEN